MHPKGRPARDGQASIAIPPKLPSTAQDMEYTEDELEFFKAVDRYKRKFNRPWPTCREVLAIAVSLGYRKVAGANGGVPT